MAYGEKYHVIYCDRNSRQYRLAIHEWNYAGASVRHKAAPSPFTITQEVSSELKLGGIYPTRATVTLVSSKVFNMEELYTADERKYLVTHEPTNGSDGGKWYGNIIPNGFTEEMDNDVHYMVITASDNLPTLKLKLFTQDDGTNYGLPDGDFQQSFMWVAKECLKKTGFLLPIATMVDVKPALTDGSVVAERKVAFYTSPNQLRIADDGTVENALEAGGAILVSGGTNDDDTFTVVSWTSGFESWPPQYVVRVTVVEAPTQHLSGENVKLSVYPVEDVSALDDPLAVTVHDVRTYVRDQDVEGKNYFEVMGSAMSTWDVLNNLAKQWNAKVFQRNGRWEIVRWNALAIDSGDYEYFLYNSEGVQTGREAFGNSVYYPCVRAEGKFRPFGHPISMDRVLGAVGVNYRYKYKQEGDSLVNLIKNGELAPRMAFPPPGPNMDPSVFVPEYWKRNNSNWVGPMQLSFAPLPPPPGSSYPPGLPYLAMSGNFYFNSYFANNTGYPAVVNQGDRLRISLWWRGRYRNGGMSNVLVLRVSVRPPTADSDRVQLVNVGASGLGYLSGLTPAQLGSPVNLKSNWVQWTAHSDDKLSFEVGSEVTGFASPGTPTPWRNYIIDVPACPVSGQLVIEVTGTGGSQVFGSPISNGFDPRYSRIDPFGAYNPLGFYENGQGDIAGIFAGKIVDPSNEAVAQIHPYWFNNDGAYTDSIDDIEVLTGDDNDPDHVSNIYVMDGGQPKPNKLWDSWAGDFGWSALGLTLAKSIMQQYYRPWRIIDGDFVAESIDWMTRFEFEQRPGERYAILRGSIDPRRNRFSGTIVQVRDDATPELPPGGNDGGGTVDPNWQPTGTVRCVREDGENTGDQERLEVDVNPGSPTNGQQRWVNIGENLDACPVGEPIDLYWGASTLPIDPLTLEYFPYVKVGDNYTVDYANDGSGKYLVLLHRSSLGTVRSILDVELEETISNWTYEVDQTINGYAYKVLRMNYMTGVFTGHPKTFKIN